MTLLFFECTLQHPADCKHKANREFIRTGEKRPFLLQKILVSMKESLCVCQGGPINCKYGRLWSVQEEEKDETI